MSPSFGLIVSGANTHVFYLLGALAEALFDPSTHGLYDKRVNRFYGTSAGALLCFLIVVYRFELHPSSSPCDEKTRFRRVVQTFVETMLSHVWKSNVRRLWVDFGIFDTQWVIRELFVQLGLAHDMTFGDLYARCGRGDFEFQINTFCVNEGRTRVFGCGSDPNVPIRIALAMTCAVPFLFNAPEYQGLRYVDGSVTQYVPRPPEEKNHNHYWIMVPDTKTRTAPLTWQDHISAVIFAGIRTQVSTHVFEPQDTVHYIHWNPEYAVPRLFSSLKWTHVDRMMLSGADQYRHHYRLPRHASCSPSSERTSCA